MAVEFRRLGHLQEAADSFARSLHIKERELGQFHPSTARVLNNYALVRWRMGHLDTALALFNRLPDLYDTLDQVGAATRRVHATPRSIRAFNYTPRPVFINNSR